MKTTIFSEISIDGKMTTKRDENSKALFETFTEKDKRFIHSYRGKNDAIMVGKNTIITDNPMLTNRYEKNNNPIRIVPTINMDIPIEANVFSNDSQTIILTVNKNIHHPLVKQVEKLGHRCLFYGENEINFKQFYLDASKIYGINSILVEGGGTLNWTLLRNNLVDEIVLLQLPIIIGGRDNVTLVDGIEFIAREFPSYQLYDIEKKPHFLVMKYKKNEV